jgi:hypothetical protein
MARTHHNLVGTTGKTPPVRLERIIEGLRMNRTLGIVILTSLIALLAGCGATGAETDPSQQVSQATLAATATQPSPTETLPPTVESLPTASPVAPTTAEPTDTSAPPPTATVEVPSPTPEATATPIPSETPVTVLTSQDVRRISPADAKALLDSDGAVLYDARSAGEYRTRHAAGALSLPESEVAARFGELPAGKALVFY